MSTKYIQTKNLGSLSHGLNIEGGFPYLDLINYNPKAIWSNIIISLDNPIEDNVLFDHILETVNANNYPLLENAIAELNEHQMLATLLLVALYYIENARNILNYDSEQTINILIYIHQDKIAINLINIIDYYLHELIKLFNINSFKITLSYQTDNYIYIKTPQNYNCVDILLSFSQCAGLSHNKPGTILIANEFIPFDIQNNKIYLSKKYTAKNDIFNRIHDMLNKDYNEKICDYINKNYISSNPEKKNVCDIVTRSEFKITPILQVDDLWNPSDKDKNIELIE
jgi:hypothetical protein